MDFIIQFNEFIYHVFYGFSMFFFNVFNLSIIPFHLYPLLFLLVFCPLIVSVVFKFLSK